MPRKKSVLSRVSTKARRMRTLRAKETEEQRNKRLEKQRIAAKQNRANETPVQRSQRLMTQRLLASAYRAGKCRAERAKRNHLLTERLMLNVTKARIQTQLLLLAYICNSSVDNSEMSEADIGTMNSIWIDSQEARCKVEEPDIHISTDESKIWIHCQEIKCELEECDTDSSESPE